MNERITELLWALVAVLIVLFSLQIWIYFVSGGLVCQVRNVPMTDPFWLFSNCWFEFVFK